MLLPVSEVLLDAGSIERFRIAYRALAGAKAADDPLYAAVSAGQRYPGMEHWLPLFWTGWRPCSTTYPMRRWCSTTRPRRPATAGWR